MHFTIAASMKKRTITLEKFFFISFCFHFSRRIRSGRFLTLIFLYTYVLVIEIDILKPPCINIIVLKSIFLHIEFFKIML